MRSGLQFIPIARSHLPVEGSQCQRACVGFEVMETAAELQTDSLL